MLGDSKARLSDSFLLWSLSQETHTGLRSRNLVALHDAGRSDASYLVPVTGLPHWRSVSALHVALRVRSLRRASKHTTQNKQTNKNRKKLMRWEWIVKSINWELEPVSWRPTTVRWRQFSQSNRHSTIGPRQTEYHEALPLSANDEVRCDCTFTDDGNASWYSVCRVPMVEWRLDCEDCHHLTVGLWKLSSPDGRRPPWYRPQVLSRRTTKRRRAGQRRDNPWIAKGQKSDWPSVLSLAWVIVYIWKGAAHATNVLPRKCFQCTCSWYTARLSSLLSRFPVCIERTLIYTVHIGTTL